MIYLLENSDTLGEEFISAAVPRLSMQRIKKMDSLRLKNDKVNSAAVYLLLRYALRNEYAITDIKPEFVFGNNGKPYLKQYPEIFFSLSHCRNACACILSKNETAVDITDIRKIMLRTAKYFCSTEELEAAQTAKDIPAELIRLWTMKECYSKIDGSGLSADFKLITSKKLSDIHIIKNERYYAAYFSEQEENIIKLLSSELLDN